ncbi:uncharacterized protein LOC6650918 isoform X1 [Drosophila willistoni]|uniref:uncharacterized protein LOC6650918 isoform X1 n=1 Tax=Drosophila willistoni TaxID=7260 RepID=UPI000C26CE1E|nr:uncharacterized protein LOC6650918 isoform X1 [Drosophila willistoni]
MPNVKYLCVLPTVEKDTDRLTKLTVRGTLTGNPQEFSVNFVNDPTCTDNITYHFKVLVRLQTIIENYKQKGEWSLSHKETYLNIFDGTGSIDSKSDLINNNNAADAISSTETDFYLEFTLDYANSTIVVYQLRDSGHNFICEYNTLFDLTEIQAVQIWGDVQKINLFAMGYD